MSLAACVLLATIAGGVSAAPNAWGPQGHSWGAPTQPWTNHLPFPTAASSTCPSAAPTYKRNTTFTYPITTSVEYATAVSTGTTSTYALAYAQVSALFTSISTTSWPNWTPISSSAAAAVTAPANKYGVEAYSSLWDDAKVTNFSRGIYSATAAPTPIPSSALVKPPPLYFQPENCYRFPEEFIFGAAGSAGQCEGAIADQGKSPSFLDLTANVLAAFGQSQVTDVTGKSTGDLINNAVTAEHYYLYKRDIDSLAAAGIKHFYFTISWTRILPFALPGTPVNSYGIAHYNDVIDYVLSKGMVPVVAITHFDTPLQFYGGASEYLIQIATAATTATYGLGGITFAYNNATFEDAYVNYAKIVLSHYADRVPIWITFNEPQVGSTTAGAVTNVLRAHARTYRYYKETLKGTGKMSIKMGITPAVPQDASNASHIEAAQFFSDVYTFPWLYPTALGQQYPAAFLKGVAGAQPLNASDLALMNGTMDFVSIDGYSAPVIIPAVKDLAACAAAHNATRPFPICVNATTLTTTGWSTGYAITGSPTDYTFPQGLRTQLNQVWSLFGLPVMVTEFGLSVPVPPGGRLQDNLYNVPQSEYIISYLNEMLKAIWEDGVHVMGALVWTFLDDWEFGYNNKGFGLQYLNRTTQERVYRRSIFDVVDFVEGRRQG